MKIDFTKIRTYPLRERKSKVSVKDFAGPITGSMSVDRFIAALPDILATHDFRAIVEACRTARQRGKPIIWAIGGHVIKCGLSPVLIDLMKRGYVQHLAMNGAGLIHDFEISMVGSTSEDVEASLGQGGFGMARETGEWVNRAINGQVAAGCGLAEAVGKSLVEGFNRVAAGSSRRNANSGPRFDFLKLSLLATAYRMKIPATIHLAIGTDIIHNHPAVDGRCLGEGALRDYRTFVESVAGLSGGGVFLNFGSAVIMPEVFLKAVSLVRNQGLPLRHFTTANFDFIQHYRGVQNVVKRPTQRGAGRGFSITGHHEFMLPLLAAALTGRLPNVRKRG
ncbi:MAG: hypothetical protein PHX83_05235 [Acidobacteriia bacterium]|nr:hypothetical protein [Terriglobia bacterium]